MLGETFEESVKEKVAEQLDEEQEVDDKLNVDPELNEVGGVCEVHLADNNAQNVENTHDVHE